MGSALNESLPVNSTDRTRVLLRLDGAIRNDDVSADLALHAVERAVPIRRFFAWPGKRNYEGLWWSSTVRVHVPFESLLERDYLMWADFETDIVAIAAQPLALLWPRGERRGMPKQYAGASGSCCELLGLTPVTFVGALRYPCDSFARVASSVRNPWLLPSDAFIGSGSPAAARVVSITNLTAGTIGLPRRRKLTLAATTSCSATTSKGGLRLRTIGIRPYGNVILIRTVWSHLIRKMLA
ncbi:hypothetical protein [Mycobacterium riyadhense]|uniref:hypothetical protein n=1 Tax=Mycobacterium riyadhense TaxID=486698 RepID=UPI001EF9DDA4|nr:hypothetical protein [Mycobacterium riyadhense]